MQTLFHILTIIIIAFLILVFLGQIISDTKTLYKGFRKGSEEQNRDHTLKNEN